MLECHTELLSITARPGRSNFISSGENPFEMQVCGIRGGAVHLTRSGAVGLTRGGAVDLALVPGSGLCLVRLGCPSDGKRLVSRPRVSLCFGQETSQGHLAHKKSPPLLVPP